MNGEILSVLGTLEREKGIAREVRIEGVEEALVLGGRKSLGDGAGEITLQVNPKSGKLKVLADAKA